MKKNKISVVSRILLIISGLILLLALIYPLWRIDLVAPQYPEGLRLLIHADKLSGDVEIINGLNHYIGMRTLHVEDFPEFKILPGIIIVFSILFILTGIIGKRKLVNILLIIFILFGIVAMADFWRWEYDYGHNLDPSAAIKVPGQAYQPPLIGFKQLLNFGAYSIPDIGGWAFVAAGIFLALAVFIEWRAVKRMKKNSYIPLILLLLGFSIQGCSSGPQPINYGRDNCHFCKMTISDKRFGAEVVSSTGKVFKFDDLHCVNAFLKDGEVDRSKVKGIYVSDYLPPNEFIESSDAVFFKSEDLRSPMAGNVAALRDEKEVQKISGTLNGKVVSSSEVLK